MNYFSKALKSRRTQLVWVYVNGLSSLDILKNPPCSVLQVILKNHFVALPLVYISWWMLESASVAIFTTFKVFNVVFAHLSKISLIQKSSVLKFVFSMSESTIISTNTSCNPKFTQFSLSVSPFFILFGRCNAL